MATKAQVEKLEREITRLKDQNKKYETWLRSINEHYKMIIGNLDDIMSTTSIVQGQFDDVINAIDAIQEKPSD